MFLKIYPFIKLPVFQNFAIFVKFLNKKDSATIIRDLDSDKVLTRLASVEEIEPEYIGFLATYFHDTTAAVS